jgi:citrate lyase subunit beta/citryl-CoA lyase
MLAKARELAADVVMVDLEDSVAAANKTDATRAGVASALREGGWAARSLAVRVNGVRTPWFADDLAQVVGAAGDAVRCIVLPKVESPDEVRQAAALLARLGVATGIEAQIETARGLIEAERIAGSSERLESLVYGPGDFAASMGIPHLDIGGGDDAYPGDQWHYVRSRIAVAARAFGLDAIDGPHGGLDDLEGLRRSALHARALGFTGKWAIHPSQIAVCEEVFSPTAEEVDRARRLLAALDGAEGRGAAVFEGAMVDEASRRQALALLARAPVGARADAHHASS